MKKPLPKFKLLSPAQQRALYPDKLERAYRVSKQRIQKQHALALVEAASLDAKAEALDLKIEKTEERVANRADVNHKGWWVWRRDQKLLHLVIAEMVAASAPLRVIASALRARATSLRAPMLKELEELDTAHRKLQKNLSRLNPE